MFNTERAIESDLEDIAALFDMYRVFYGQPSDLSGGRTFITERFKSSESVIFLARSGSGVAVGFAQLYPSFSSQSMRRTWILNDLYVHADFRCLGVATSLITAVKQFSSAQGAKGVMLCTQVTNVKAQKLYEKNEFHRLSEYQWYFSVTDNLQGIS